jgi:hypothetical protein
MIRQLEKPSAKHDIDPKDVSPLTAGSMRESYYYFPIISEYPGLCS